MANRTLLTAWRPSRARHGRTSPVVTREPFALKYLEAAADFDTSPAVATYCHPNTVRHRLRRIKARTGRSLAIPDQLAELRLAFEIRQTGPQTFRSRRGPLF